MKWIRDSVVRLAIASKGNPAVSTATVILFWFAFNVLLAVVEKLIFGERFEHWLDPIFSVLFIGYAACGVWLALPITLPIRVIDMKLLTLKFETENGDIELTLEQARELYQNLDELFGSKAPVYIPYTPPATPEVVPYRIYPGPTCVPSVWTSWTAS